MSALVDVVGTSSAVWPSLAPRLVVGKPMDIATERHGLLSGEALVGEPLLAELEASGLRGKGGAGFPVARKWSAIRDRSQTGGSVVVANGEEGEPDSLKDRWILTHRPHLVLDGLSLAARTLGAVRAIIYLSHLETVAAVQHAIDEHPSTCVPIEIHIVQPTYVAGEESAVVRSINGGPALPTAKPPRPFELGVDGLPTLIQNVETLAHVAWIARRGAGAFRSVGAELSPGTTLVTLRSGRGTVVAEVPFGPTIGEIFEHCGGGVPSAPQALLVGGWFGGIAPTALLDVAFTYEALADRGAAVGCGAITIVGSDEDLGARAARLAGWYASQSAGQCGACVKGTAAIRDALEQAHLGTPGATVGADLARWGQTLRGRGACAFLDGAANLARSISTDFPQLMKGDRPR
jgi:NADH:ubiquinone oxidoreductase subunit F (NADH-binding)